MYTCVFEMVCRFLHNACFNNLIKIGKGMLWNIIFNILWKHLHISNIGNISDYLRKLLCKYTWFQTYLPLLSGIFFCSVINCRSPVAIYTFFVYSLNGISQWRRYFLTRSLSVPLIMSVLSGDLFPPRAPTPSHSSISLRLAEFLWELVGGCGGPPWVIVCFDVLV